MLIARDVRRHETGLPWTKKNLHCVVARGQDADRLLCAVIDLPVIYTSFDVSAKVSVLRKS